MAFGLVVVRLVNWGLVGLAQFDLVAALFGGSSALLSRIVYSLVGIAGVLAVILQTVPQTQLGNLRPAASQH